MINDEARRLARQWGHVAFHILVASNRENVAFYCVERMIGFDHDPARPRWCPRTEHHNGDFTHLEGYEVYTVEEVLAHRETTYPAEVYQLLEDRTRVHEPGQPEIWHLMWDPNRPSSNTYCIFEWNDNDDEGNPLPHRNTDPHYCPFIEADRRRVADGRYAEADTWADWHVATPAELNNPPAPVRSTHSSWTTP